MPCTEAYREHIMYTFNGFCKVVIRNAAITAWRDQHRQHKREISLEYLATGDQIRRTLQLLHKEMEMLSHGESEPFALSNDCPGNQRRAGQQKAPT